MDGPAEEARSALSARLRARRLEIEQAAIIRIYGISGAVDPVDPAYIDGLHAAVAAALDYGFDVVELGEQCPVAIPGVLLLQARLAAQSGVRLETVLRRYFAGYTLLGDFLVEEAESGGFLGGPELKQLLRAQAAFFEHLMAAVTNEYASESNSQLDTVEQRRVECVERLLAGKLFHAPELVYEFDGNHLGLIATGPEAPKAIRSLAQSLDRRLLMVRHRDGAIWAWLGGQRRIAPDDIKRNGSWGGHPQLALAVGEPGHGLAGWRKTHLQAHAALPIALRTSKKVVRYADVALAASMLRDDLLAASLHDLYLAPLSRGRDGGTVLRQTLRAYFDAQRNVSSAAAALGVTRQTVGNRLRAIEELFARPLSSCAAEIEAALRLEDLGYPLNPYPAFA